MWTEGTCLAETVVWIGQTYKLTILPKFSRPKQLKGVAVSPHKVDYRYLVSFSSEFTCLSAACTVFV